MNKNRKKILSLCLSGHGLSGAIFIDGFVKVASTLERISRLKNDILLPISMQDLKDFGWNASPKIYKNSIDLPFDFELKPKDVIFEENKKFNIFLNYLLIEANLKISEIECVVYSYRYIKQAKSYFKKKAPNAEFLVPEHHLSHACQAFFTSNFDEAAIMIVDGQGVPMDRTFGDQLSGCIGYGNKEQIQIYEEFPVKYSLGSMYSSFTSKIGFKTNEEGKTMGLAPYGTDKIFKKMRKDLLFDVSKFDLKNLRKLFFNKFQPEHFTYILPNYIKFLNNYPNRKIDQPISEIHKDLAFAVQKITEEVMIYIANKVYKKTKSKNLCIAGGVGLNCVANYQVLRNSPFKNIYIHPNPGDNGLVIGQALWAYRLGQKHKNKYIATHDYLGKKYSKNDFKLALNFLNSNPNVSIVECKNIDDLYQNIAKDIMDGKIASWFQGRSEFGPRALGNRSILADPRRADMKDILNLRVKFRESFRPFTPSVLDENCQEFFELNFSSPFMLHAAYVKKDKIKQIPAVTHVDNTARIQTVSKDVNERYYNLIKKFKNLTKIPMLLDTSFNVAGEPIVESPLDAVKCFMSTDIDVLGIDKFYVKKIK